MRGALVDDGGNSSAPKALAPIAGSSVSTLTSFPLSTLQTERTDFPHSALVQDPTVGNAKLPFQTLRYAKP